ncbi:unnamed protein product [Timema podura]|uniref:Uncharacterized protein n=1 Tax=Timema podura TaxID=61482 RepID=A0ABN7PE82_TIMPD|nr:unnamed protein product [Timema podura]
MSIYDRIQEEVSSPSHQGPMLPQKEQILHGVGRTHSMYFLGGGGGGEPPQRVEGDHGPLHGVWKVVHVLLNTAVRTGRAA